MRGEDVNGAPTVSSGSTPTGVFRRVAAPFDVVDVATLAPDGKIQELPHRLDTVDVRPAFEADVGRTSWRWHRMRSTAEADAVSRPLAPVAAQALRALRCPGLSLVARSRLVCRSLRSLLDHCGRGQRSDHHPCPRFRAAGAAAARA